MSFILVNNFNTTLSAASSSTATTFTVSSSTNLPTLASGEVLPITLNDAATRLVFEICYVTGISGNILTVERAQEGTSAQNWNVGDFIWNGPTAGTVLLNDTTDPFTASGLITANGGIDVAGGTLTIPNATASNQAVAQGQLLQTNPLNWPLASVGNATSLSTTSPTYTAPCDGFFFVWVDGVTSANGSACAITSSLAGFVRNQGTGVYLQFAASGYLPVTAGQSSTFTVTATTSTAEDMTIVGRVLFFPTP